LADAISRCAKNVARAVGGISGCPANANAQSKIIDIKIEIRHSLFPFLQVYVG
jgi:hypothetical protein